MLGEAPNRGSRPLLGDAEANRFSGLGGIVEFLGWAWVAAGVLGAVWFWHEAGAAVDRLESGGVTRTVDSFLASWGTAVALGALLHAVTAGLLVVLIARAAQSIIDGGHHRW